MQKYRCLLLCFLISQCLIYTNADQHSNAPEHHEFNDGKLAQPRHESGPEEEHEDHGEGHEGGKGGHGGHGHHERYQVFHFDFESLEGPYVVSLWILIASIAKVGFHMSGKLSKIFPESCLLIVLGFFVGIVVYFAFQGHDEKEYTLQADIFFHFLLPPIILDAGYFMPNRPFFNNIGTILLFAVVGTIWNMATIGATLWAVSQAGWMTEDFSLLHCLVFSSLISAVDPVAVLAVFEEIHVNDQLNIVVFGESLLNDAVTVVLYHMFKDYALQPSIQAIDMFAGLLQFFIVALGGVFFGVIFGLACAFATKFTTHVRVVEPIFVFLAAYLAYLTAEMFHLSGIMALTFCGMTMKNYVVHNISENSRITVKCFLKMLSSMTETVIFMMLGTSAIQDNHVMDVVFIFVTILSCLVYRCIGVLGFTFLVNKKRMSKLSFVDQFVMCYGGLRGAIAFALAMLLEDDLFPQRNIFVTTTILVVLFTVFVQGITIGPLVSALKVKKRISNEPTMSEEITNRLMDHTTAAIEHITSYHGNHWLRDKWEYYDTKYLKKVLLKEKPKTRENKLIRTHSKLSMADAMQQMKQGTSNKHARITDEKSLLRMIKNWSVSSFQSGEFSTAGDDTADLSHNDTVVDMQALDSTFSKKIADASKTHHMLEQSLMAGPRQRWSKPSRYNYDDDDDDEKSNAPHMAKIHMKNMISKHQYDLQEEKKRHAAKRQKSGLSKNVSFANSARPNIKFKGHHSDDSDEDDMLQFTASPDYYNNEDTSESASPVALDSELPWKRTTGREGLPSVSMSPDDNNPDVPVWPGSSDYYHTDNGKPSKTNRF